MTNLEGRGNLPITRPQNNSYPNWHGDTINKHTVLVIERMGYEQIDSEFFQYINIDTLTVKEYKENIQEALDYAYKNDLVVQVNNRQVMDWIDIGTINTSGVIIIGNNEEIAKDHYELED